MNKRGLVYLGLISSLFTPGCGSDSTNQTGNFNNSSVASVGGRVLTITEPATITRNGDTVDSLEVEGFDASGARVFGPVIVPFSNRMLVSNVPASVESVQLDYLRNGSFMLFRADLPIYKGDLLDDPSEVATTPQQTQFQVVPKGNAFELLRTVTGPSNTREQVSPREGPTPMRIKGVCYSPAPINYSNKFPPSIGDLFWDTKEIRYGTGPNDVNYLYNWGSLWDTFYDRNIGNSRADLDKIRDLGANTVRLYSAPAYHLTVNGGFPTIPGSTDDHHEHKAFLDSCWKRKQEGKDLSVIVDIPMSDACYQLAVRNGRLVRESNANNPNLTPEALEALVATHVAAKNIEVAFWEANLVETVKQYKDHPATMGFNIMNEQGGDRSASPNGGDGADYDETQYFYAQSVKYAKAVKDEAPDKLCGWAYHDSPAMVKFASRNPSSGAKYAEQLAQYFDYWGINSYQTINWEPVMGAGFPGSYSDLPASMKKPVLLTEVGWSSTIHDNGNLAETATSRGQVAAKIRQMFTLMKQQELFLGSCYFEFSDEWWKQAGLNKLDYTHDIGEVNGNWPTGFQDEEAFGLYSISRDGGRPDNDLTYITFGPDPTAAGGNKGPKPPFDKLTPKTEMINALKEMYRD